MIILQDKERDCCATLSFLTLTLARLKQCIKVNERVIFSEGTLAFISFALKQTLSTTKPRNSGFEQTEYSDLLLSKFVITNMEIEGNKRQETKYKFAIVSFLIQ